MLAAGQGKLIYTDIFEAFFVEVKVALFAALMITFPVLATQLWQFVAPGLYAKEKKAFLPFLLMTPFFFGAGAAFAYFVAMPWALHFLLGYQGDIGGVQQEALPGGRQLSELLDPLPVRLRGRLPAAGAADAARAGGPGHPRAAGAVAALRDRRLRVVSAVLTPPDVVSQLMLLVPLYSLYELAILAIRFTHWRASRRGQGREPQMREEEPQTNVGPDAPPGGGEGWRFRAHLIG